MKGLIHKHDLRIYKTWLRFCFHEETMTKACGEDVSHANGYTWWPKQDDTIWIYLDKNDTGAINVASAAHEAFHAADFILERTGMVVQEGTGNEHMAYLIGHIMDLIFDALDLDNKMEFGND